MTTSSSSQVITEYGKQNIFGVKHSLSL